MRIRTVVTTSGSKAVQVITISIVNGLSLNISVLGKPRVSLLRYTCFVHWDTCGYSLRSNSWTRPS